MMSAVSKKNARAVPKQRAVPLGGECIAAEYIKAGGMEHFLAFKKQLIEEFNGLGIDGMPEITELYELCGIHVNLEYPLPSGEKVKLLKDTDVYLGIQVECLHAKGSKNGRCYGLVAGMDFLLVSEYGENGTEPDVVVFKRR